MPRSLSDQDVETFRDRLCDAAEIQFARHGLEAVTMRQLAADLGVSPMTPYRYFKDKDAILAAVRARAFNRHAEALEAAFADTPGDLVDKAQGVSHAYVKFAFDHSEAYRLMFDIRQPSAWDYPELVVAATRSRATMTAHLKQMIAAGTLKGDADLIGHVYWSAIHGPIMLQLSGMLEKGLDAPKLISAMMTALNPYFFGET